MEVCGQWDSLFFQSQEAGRNEKNAVRQYADRGSSSCRADCQRKGKSKRGKIGTFKENIGESWGAQDKNAGEFLSTKIIIVGFVCEWDVSAAT